MDKNEKLVHQINKLIQINMDRMLLFEKARTLVDSKNLKDLFEQCICQSNTYGSKLKTTMLFNGVKLECRPSIFGHLSRGWIQLRSIFYKNRNISVLKSCLEAEKMTSLNYNFICENRFLQYYYPLLKYVFLKQYFALSQTREKLESALNEEQSSVIPLLSAEGEPMMTGS